MRILIAGGSGLIGSALTSAMANDGDEIAILSRKPEKVIGLPAGVKVLQWDGKTIDQWAESLAQTDVVVNLTGENLSGDGFFPSRWTAERKARLLSSRVNSGKVLAKAIELSSKRPTVFIQASGIGYYGASLDQVFTETSPGGNDFFTDLCKEWEASSAQVEALGVRRVIVRNGVVLSTRGGALPLIVLPYKLFVGGRLGNGNQVYSWIHLKDEINAIRFLIRNGSAAGVFNLTSPNPMQNNEFGETIGMVLKRPHYFPVPGIILKIMLGEVSSLVLDGQRVIPERLIEYGFIFEFPTLDKALQNLFSK